MEHHLIRSQLEGFRMIDRIETVEAGTIQGSCTFLGGAIFTLIEALAQLGALHVRSLTGFSRHAFLLKIGRCTLPDGNPAAGPCLIRGEQTGRSENGFAYRLAAERDGQVLIAGEFLFATVDYNERFTRENLADHYERLFACLHNDTKTA